MEAQIFYTFCSPQRGALMPSSTISCAPTPLMACLAMFKRYNVWIPRTGLAPLICDIVSYSLFVGNYLKALHFSYFIA